MKQESGGSSKPTGSLTAKLSGTRNVSRWWKLRNVLRFSFLQGWFTARIATPFINAFGGLTAYGKLEAVKIVLSDEDKHVFQFMMKQAEALEDDAARNRAVMDAQKWAYTNGMKINYGVLSYRSVTTAFVNFVVDQLQVETSVFGDFKFHDGGVGVTAENITDTAMETTDGEARATGTQTESAANAYRSVGTISYTTTKAITEHGLFNDLTVGTLMDRSVFSAINVVNGDSIQMTYTITLSAGG